MRTLVRLTYVSFIILFIELSLCSVSLLVCPQRTVDAVRFSFTLLSLDRLFLARSLRFSFLKNLLFFSVLSVSLVFHPVRVFSRFLFLPRKSHDFFPLGNEKNAREGGSDKPADVRCPLTTHASCICFFFFFFSFRLISFRSFANFIFFHCTAVCHHSGNVTAFATSSQRTNVEKKPVNQRFEIKIRKKK